MLKAKKDFIKKQTLAQVLNTLQSLETFLQELYRSSPVAVSCWVITVIKKNYSPEYHFNIIVIDSEWFSFSSTRKWQSQPPFINVVSWLYIVVNFSSPFLVWCAVGIFESSLPLFLTSLVTRLLWRKQYHIFFSHLAYLDQV